MIRRYIPFTMAVLLVAAVSPVRAGTLRVCADPDYLPFSNRSGQGFENKIAEFVTKTMGDQLEYTWGNYRGSGGFAEFLSATLDAGKCDLVMNIPYGSQEELTTDPYYVSSYVFVYEKKKDWDIESMDSPVLHKLKIGFESNTPPEDGLKIRDLIFDSEVFHIGDDAGISPEAVLKAVESGKVDVMITWEPAIGWFLKNYPNLRVVRVPNSRTMGSPEQYLFPMSMGVKKGNEKLAKQVNTIIADHKKELQDILNQYNVRLYETAGETL